MSLLIDENKPDTAQSDPALVTYGDENAFVTFGVPISAVMVIRDKLLMLVLFVPVTAFVRLVVVIGIPIAIMCLCHL